MNQLLTEDRFTKLQSLNAANLGHGIETGEILEFRGIPDAVKRKVGQHLEAAVIQGQPDTAQENEALTRCFGVDHQTSEEARVSFIYSTRLSDTEGVSASEYNVRWYDFMKKTMHQPGKALERMLAYEMSQGSGDISYEVAGGTADGVLQTDIVAKGFQNLQGLDIQLKNKAGGFHPPSMQDISGSMVYGINPGTLGTLQSMAHQGHLHDRNKHVLMTTFDMEDNDIFLQSLYDWVYAAKESFDDEQLRNYYQHLRRYGLSNTPENLYRLASEGKIQVTLDPDGPTKYIDRTYRDRIRGAKRSYEDYVSHLDTLLHRPSEVRVLGRQKASMEDVSKSGRSVFLRPRNETHGSTITCIGDDRFLLSYFAPDTHGSGVQFDTFLDVGQVAKVLGESPQVGSQWTGEQEIAGQKAA